MGVKLCVEASIGAWFFLIRQYQRTTKEDTSNAEECIAAYVGMTCSYIRSCSGCWRTGSLSIVTKMWTLVLLLPRGIRCNLFRDFLCTAVAYTFNPQWIPGCSKSQHHSSYIPCRHTDLVIIRRGERRKHFDGVLICEIAQHSIAHSA